MKQAFPFQHPLTKEHQPQLSASSSVHIQERWVSQQGSSLHINLVSSLSYANFILSGFSVIHIPMNTTGMRSIFKWRLWISNMMTLLGWSFST
jgi:hypothetical protein